MVYCIQILEAITNGLRMSKAIQNYCAEESSRIKGIVALWPHHVQRKIDAMVVNGSVRCSRREDGQEPTYHLPEAGAVQVPPVPTDVVTTEGAPMEESQTDEAQMGEVPMGD